VRSRGYAFQVELTHRALRHGFKVVEVPITFRDRQLGRSKMSPRIAGEAVVLLPRLRRRRPRPSVQPGTAEPSQPPIAGQ
jgi:dolichol-phosphate mannosyltransferase